MMNCVLILIPNLGGWANAPIWDATALQSLLMWMTSVILLSSTYVGSMQKRSMNKTWLFLSGLSICCISGNPSPMIRRLLCFASHLLMMARQLSLMQFACTCFALGDCALFLTGDQVDGNRSGRRRPWRVWWRSTRQKERQITNSLSNNEHKMGPLMRHFEFLMELRDKVRATRVVTTLVKGM